MPPYASSTSKQSRPVSPAWRHTSRLTWPSASHCSWWGATSLSKKARATLRKSSCSSVYMEVGFVMRPPSQRHCHNSSVSVTVVTAEPAEAEEDLLTIDELSAAVGV